MKIIHDLLDEGLYKFEINDVDDEDERIMTVNVLMVTKKKMATEITKLLIPSLTTMKYLFMELNVLLQNTIVSLTSEEISDSPIIGVRRVRI